MQADGGAAGFVDIVARLLGATFGGRTPMRRSALQGRACDAGLDRIRLRPRRDAPHPTLSLGRRDGRRASASCACRRAISGP